MNRILDALRCWIGRPRWEHHQFMFHVYTVCTHCEAEAGSRRHPKGRA